MKHYNNIHSDVKQALAILLLLFYLYALNSKPFVAFAHEAYHVLQEEIAHSKKDNRTIFANVSHNDNKETHKHNQVLDAVISSLTVDSNSGLQMSENSKAMNFSVSVHLKESFLYKHFIESGIDIRNQRCTRPISLVFSLFVPPDFT